MIQFDICQKACSSSKQRALIAEEIKQQNWEPSFVRVCRCYATVPHSTEPPSNIVTLVIFMVELYEADATQCSAACLLLQLQLADTDSTVLVQLRTRTFMMQHVNLIFIKCHDTVFLSRSSKLIVITSPSHAIQNFRIVRNVVGQKQLFIARDVAIQNNLHIFSEAQPPPNTKCKYAWIMDKKWTREYHPVLRYSFTSRVETNTLPASVVLSVASRYALPGYGDRRVWVRGPGWSHHCIRLQRRML